MNTIYADSTAYRFVGLGSQPKRLSRETGEIATDREGKPKWVVDVYLTEIGSERSDLVKITVVSMEEPKIVTGQPVRLPGLRATYWEQGTRHGLAWAADAVEAAAPAKAQTKPAA